MPLVQRFAQIFGAIYLLVGILGFIPPLVVGELPPQVIGGMGPFGGLLLGLFAVNWFHSLTHLLIGAAGLAVYGSFSASRAYALALGVAYGALAVLGLLFGVLFLGGLMPLNRWDHALHLLTALVVFGAYFSDRVGAYFSDGAAEPRTLEFRRETGGFAESRVLTLALFAAAFVSIVVGLFGGFQSLLSLGAVLGAGGIVKLLAVDL